MAIFMVVFFFLTRYVWNQRQSLQAVSAPNAGWAICASAVGITGLLISASGYMLLIRACGEKVSYGQTIGLLFLPQLTKYIPGKIWVAVAAIHMYGQQGISRKVAGVCFSLLFALSTAAGILVTVTFGATTGDLWISIGACLIVLLAVLLAIYPPVFYGVINWGLRAIRRETIDVAIPLSRLFVVLGIFICARMTYGIGFSLVVRSFESVGVSYVPGLIALFTFAQIAGVMVLFAPAGIGVREGVLLVGLQPIVGPGPAIVITGVCRVWQTALELVMAGIGWWALRCGKDTCISADGGKSAAAQTRSNDADSPTNHLAFTWVAGGEDRDNS